MKHIIITLIILITAVGLYSQTGLFGLSYGDSYETTKSILESEPYYFDQYNDEDGTYYFSSEGNEYVDRIVCFFDTFDDALVAWHVYFLEQEEEDIQELIMGSARDWHETEPVWDDDLSCWSWDLGEGRKLLIAYTWDDYLLAEYYNNDYFQFSELGN